MSVSSPSVLRFAFAAWGAIGCAGTAPAPAEPRQPALTCPAAGGTGWLELSTPHFTVWTDRSEPEALEQLADLERAQAAILEHLHESAWPSPTQVVLFARQIDFAKTAGSGRKTGGFFTTLSDGIFLSPTIVTYEGDIAGFRHELSHRLLGGYIANPPRWLDEGLAQYYAGMAIEGDRIVFGRRGFNRSFSIELPLLFVAQRDEFTGKYGSSYYQTAWALVSLLRDRHWAYRERFDRYLRALVQGKRHSAAWAESFGDISLRRLQEDLWLYRRDVKDDLIEEPYHAVTAPAPSVRNLSDVEVHALWMRLLWHNGDVAGVRRELAIARRHAPGSPELALWSAKLAERGKRYAEAEAAFQAAHDAAPDDERFAAALFFYHARRAQATGAPLETLEPEGRAIEVLARHAHTLNEIAWVHAQAQHPDEGLPLARRAVELEPRAPSFLDTLAFLLFEKGEVEEALATQEWAMTLLPDGVQSRELTEHLERFRKAADEKRPARPSAGEPKGGSVSVPERR